jgi:hypothetical protein
MFSFSLLLARAKSTLGGSPREIFAYYRPAQKAAVWKGLNL